MSRFCFYHGDDPAIAARMRAAVAALWSEVNERSTGSFWLFVAGDEAEFSLCESHSAVGAVSGYVRSDCLEHAGKDSASLDAAHNQCFISEIIKAQSWPLGNSWTGSFAAVAYSKSEHNLVICNDLIGYMPIYYAAYEAGLIGGTSLIALSHCIDCDVDITGLLQLVTTPFCAYGRRTLLRQVSRLQPGECLRFIHGQRAPEREFDNSLCNGLIEAGVDTVARRLWDCLQQEIALAAGVGDRLGVALSGGWDSRLVLRGVAHRGNTVHCYTYGNEDLYETRLARHCADAVGAHQQSFPIEGRYFPSRDRFEEVVRRTEAASVPEWYALLDVVDRQAGSTDVMLVGDHCESIDGRNMAALSSRAARRKSFINGLLGRHDEIHPTTQTKFEQWKIIKRQQILLNVLASVDRLSPALARMCDRERVAQEIAADLELSFQRVGENMPPFVPMFDELFWWFQGARFVRAGQNLMLAPRFRAVSPVMSMRSLRLISTIHPRLRMRRRLMSAIARLPEFDALARVPSSETPWISSRAPAFLRDLLWGVRSGIDQKLIKRVMQSKDVRKRQRVLRSLDYISEYRRGNVAATVQQWFSGKWISGERYSALAQDRARLIAWPLINVDIAAPANISILLDLCLPHETDEKSAVPYRDQSAGREIRSLSDHGNGVSAPSGARS